jgi:hypothetical protein
MRESQAVELVGICGNLAQRLLNAPDLLFKGFAQQNMNQIDRFDIYVTL